VFRGNTYSNLKINEIEGMGPPKKIIFNLCPFFEQKQIIGNTGCENVVQRDQIGQIFATRGKNHPKLIYITK
jgi:hypothetical protein